jgi:hypothetical protein
MGIQSGGEVVGDPVEDSIYGHIEEPLMLGIVYVGDGKGSVEGQAIEGYMISEQYQ